MAYRIPHHEDVLSIDLDAMEATARRRRRRNVLILGGIVVVVGAGGAVAAAGMNREAAVETDRAVSRLATCLLNDPTTAEAPSKSVRAEQLAVLSTPPHAQATAWPISCARVAYKLAEDAKGRSLAPLESAAAALGKALEDTDSYVKPLGVVVDRVFDEAAKAGARRSVAPDVTRAPAPAAAFTVATLPPSARWLEAAVPLQNVHSAPFPETQIRFLMDDQGLPGGPHVCAFEPAAHRVKCHVVPAPAAALSPALRLWGTTADGAAPFVFAGNRGEAGIFRGDTGALVAARVKFGAYGASALGDGSFAYLAWNDVAPQVRVVRVSPTGVAHETKLLARSETGNPYYATALFDEWVFYKALRGDAGIRLMAAKLGPETVGPATDIGRIDEIGRIEGGEGEEPHLTACRSESSMVVRAKGWEHTYFSFHAGAEWTPPVESGFIGGDLYCRGAEALVVGTTGEMANGQYWPTFVVERCSAAGCKQTDTTFKRTFGDDPELAPSRPRDVRAVPLGDKLLVVWRAGDLGGLRLRIGPPEEMTASTERAIFDDHVDETGAHPEPSLIEMGLWSTGKDALLLMHTTRGLFGLQIDPSGAAAPVTFAKE